MLKQITSLRLEQMRNPAVADYLTPQRQYPSVDQSSPARAIEVSSETQSTERASTASVHLDAIRGLAALAVFLGHGRGLFLKAGLHNALNVNASAPPVSTSATAAANIAASKSHETIGHE